MKPNAQTRRYRSNVEGGGVKMQINEAALHIVMDVMTNLYARPLEACVREYSTNAYDSHVEAGCPERPIEVTLPTQLAPHLTIQDFGIGLDDEGIREIYSQYGASTKRETNEQNGMLGMGCKSALAYGDQFTLVGIKDGIKTVVLISRDEDGTGSMTVVDESETDESDGVTVQIPVRQSDWAEVGRIASRFYAFWPEGRVLVNGEAPWRIGSDGDLDEDGDLLDLNERSFWLSDTILLTGHQYVQEDLIVMGNVPYPLMDGEDKLFDSGRARWQDTWHAVVFAPIGSVDFAPSRESLRATKQTKATLARVRQQIGALRDAEVLRQVREASSAKEAIDLLRKGRSLGFQGTAQYKGRDVQFYLSRSVPTKRVNMNEGRKDGDGKPLPPRYEDVDTITGNPGDWEVDNALKYSYLIANQTNYQRKSGERVTSFNMEAMEGAWIFTGYDGKTLTNTKRAKLELWWSRNGTDRVMPPGYTGEARKMPLPKMLFVDKLLPEEAFWLEGWKVMDWATIQAVELPKAQSGMGERLKGSYDAYVNGEREYEVPASKLDQSKPIYWFHGNVNQARTNRAIRNSVIDPAGCTIVALGANRIDKFKRDFPKAIELNEAAKKVAERWLKAQPQTLLDAYSIQRRLDDDVLPLLNEAALDDPDLRKLHAEMAAKTDDLVSKLNSYGAWINVPINDAHVKWAQNVLAKYPLLTAVSAYKLPREHMVLYLNAAYAAEKGV